MQVSEDIFGAAELVEPIMSEGNFHRSWIVRVALLIGCTPCRGKAAAATAASLSQIKPIHEPATLPYSHHCHFEQMHSKENGASRPET